MPRPAVPTSPPIDEQLTMAPLPWSRIWSSSYFMQLQMPRRLTAFTRSKSSALVSAVSASGLCTPALLNAASSRPKVETVCRTMAATSSASATSHRTPIALWPAATRSSAADRAPSSLTSAKVTAAPASAKALAVARPMPEAAPVTSATWLSKDKFMNAFLRGRAGLTSVQPLLDDLLHDRKGREHGGPAGIEGELREHLSRLLRRQSVVDRPGEMRGELSDLTGSDQGTDRDQAPIARRQIRPQPQIAEQNVGGVLDDTRRDIAELRSHVPRALGFGLIVEREGRRRR